MEQPPLSCLEEGVNELFVLGWPLEASPDDVVYGFVNVVMKRPGGGILAIPLGVISMDAVLDGASAEEDAELGPGTVLAVPGCKEEDGQVQLLGADLDVLVIDVNEAVLSSLQPFAEFQQDPTNVMGFGEDATFLPDPPTLLKFTKEWLGLSNAQRILYYSADEGQQEEPTVMKASPKVRAKAKDGGKAKAPTVAMKTASQIQQLASVIPVMASQLNMIQSEQRRMQEAMALTSMSPPQRGGQSPVTMPVRDFAKMMGAPPRTKQAASPIPAAPPLPRPGGIELDSGLSPQEQAEEGQMSQQQQMTDPLAWAMLEQSRALTSLVSHLQQGGDPLIDGQGYASSTSSRGAQGRERLQRELTARSGAFFLTVMQNAFRRLKPANPVPATLEELAQTDFAMLQYLERYGNYAGARDLGVVQYALSFIVDAAVKGDLEGIREHLALTVLALEQAAQDQGRWDMAFLMLLVDEAPQSMFTYKGASVAQTGRLRAFAPLCPQKWATIALAYIKEVDYIQSKRLEIAKKAGAPPPLQPPAAPKKKGRFPKAKAEAAPPLE